MPSTKSIMGRTKYSQEIAEAIQSFFTMRTEILATVAERYKSIDAWAKTPVFTEDAFNRLQM